MDDEEIEITEEDVRVPIRELAINDRKRVRIRDMADYHDVFFAVENTTLLYWFSHPSLKDKDVISSFDALLREFDAQREGTLASEVSKGVKAILILRKMSNARDYTLGEILSCITFLKRLAKRHKSPNKIGYLRWIKAFFEGRMPETREEIAEYIFQEEM
ncbi:MAG: hypothetical protein ACE5QW_07555 [Thermoplasmata archaeon]